jgi:hypothetical protein
MNLVDANARRAQQALMAIAHEHPEVTLREARKYCAPRHHDVRPENVDLKRLGAVLAVAYDRHLHDFAEFLLLEKLGPRTLQSLALIAEVIHGAPSRFSDPARFSFALGGKDRHPFPVPLKTYDESIEVLRRSLDAAKLPGTEKDGAFARLEGFVRAIEDTYRAEADFEALLAHEDAISSSLNGRSVFDDRRKRSRKVEREQLTLFE